MKETVIVNPSACWKHLSKWGSILFVLLIAVNFHSCDTSSAAEKASMSVKKNMDPNIDPCDNFYKFACGGFINTTVIPDDQFSVNSFSVVNDKVKKQLKKSLESKIDDDELRPFRLAKNLYKSCMDTEAIEAEGFKPIKNLLSKLGGWPVVDGDQWNDTNFHWTSSMYKLRDAGCSTSFIVDFSVYSDLKNSTKNVIYLDQASLGIPWEYLSKDSKGKMVEEYYNYIVDIAVILGADRKRAETELKESLEFEINLALISLPLDELFDNLAELYTSMTVKELLNTFPSIRWQEYFRRLLSSNVIIDDNQKAVMYGTSYIKKLEKLLTATPIRVQANYIMWRNILDLLPYLNEGLRKRQTEYAMSINGATKRMSKWRECVDTVTEKLPISVGSMYVRKYFTEEAKKDVQEMVRDIQDQAIIMLSEAEWMDDQTRKSALEKAAAMTSWIAYPDELLDDKKIEEYYAKLELSGENYLESILNITKFAVDSSFGELRKPVSDTHWIRHGQSAVVDAFYALKENSLTFSAVILQGVFYNSERPRYMNYGAIGSAIGHEIVHGFDSLGRKFNKDGNLVDWWAPLTAKNYVERAECIKHQYGNYTSEEVGMNLNGVNSQGENIADNGGFKMAYYAYNRWADRNSPEARLPGLDYTPRQMFWISAANVWCSINRPEAIKHFITVDVHSPEEFRIIGSLSNRPEFSEDFNCSIGSNMNRSNKCSVW